MKSLTAVCQTTTGASGMPALSANSGRITRHPPHRGDGENAEMKMYLSKLKDLVPFMPKNRKLSKLEIIQHVIDYICDLQTELETHPEMGNFDAAAALTAVNGLHDDEDSEMEDADADADVEPIPAPTADADVLAQRLSAEQQAAKVSSPAARLPLSDRQTPNTLLVAPAHQQQQLQQQQQQQSQQQQSQQQQQLSNSLATPLNAAEKDSRQS